MAFTVNFYQIDKKQNSTKLPIITDPTTNCDCILKGAASLLNPTIQLTTPANGASIYSFPTSYNYCYVADWNRYYFITDWSFSGPAVYASLAVDVLASYKTQIGNLSLYVARSASSYNGGIMDATYPTTTSVTWAEDKKANPFASKAGVYVVGVINTEAGAGAVSYYAMSQAAFAEFCTAMYNTISWMQIDPDEISEELQKALVNPFQYVVSCQYLPIDMTDVSGIPGNNPIYQIPFGFWSFTLTNAIYRVLPTYFTTTGTGYFTIPKHPAAATRGAYLNTSPYSTYHAVLYPFGLINLDSTDLMDASVLYYFIYTDISTGRAILNLEVGSGVIRMIETQVGVAIPTAAIQLDYSQWQAGLISAGASIIQSISNGSGGFLSASSSGIKSAALSTYEKLYGSGAGVESSGGLVEKIGGAATNILSSAMAAMTRAEIMGQLGMRTGYATQAISLVGKFLGIADEDLTNRGRPLCSIVQLNTLSGYIQVADADLSISGATATEQSAIVNFLTGGFFYE